MNIKHSVNARRNIGTRSFFRRFVTAATLGAMMLGVASASADGGNGSGSFSITTIAGVGEKYTGKLDVKGDGKFSVTDDGGNLVFVSKVADGELNMKDGRQDHTVGKDSKLGLKSGQKVKLVVKKSDLTFPEPGKEASGTATGTLTMLQKDQKVSIKYTVLNEGGKYTVKNASFDFDYTKHVVDDSGKPKKVCLMLVCVRPMVNITIKNAVIEAKK
jgi:hypothetical protein